MAEPKLEMGRVSEQSVEHRLREIEDRLEIYNLIAGHPASADTGSSHYPMQVYLEDGVFDRGEVTKGAAALGAQVVTPAHLQASETGVCHFAGLPHVRIDGDTASVTSCLQILMPDPNGPVVELANHGSSKGYRVHRLGANRWELARTKEGWKVKHRTSRPVETKEAREILRRGIA